MSKKITQPVKQSQSQQPWNQKIWLTVTLVLTGLVYAASFKNKLTNWDDAGYITNNPLIRDLSWKGIQAMFSESYGGNYHPLVALGNAIEYSLWGLKVEGYHAINLIFHLLNTYLIYQVVKNLFRDIRIALVASLFFGIHPMHVESVVWLAERKDVQFTFFFLLAWQSGIKWIKGGGMLNLFGMFGFIMLSLLSKSTAVVFPGVFLLTYWWMGAKWSLKAWGSSLILIAMAILIGIKAIETQATTLQDFTTPDLSWPDRFAVAGYGLGYYLISSLFPFWLCHLHPFPNQGEASLIHYAVLLVVVLLIVGLLFKSKSKKLVVFTMLFFVGTQILTLQLIPVGKAIMAERYTYLPYILLFAAFADYFLNRAHWINVKSKPIFIWGLAILFGFVAFNRTRDWKNAETLWKDGVEKYPDSYYSWFGYSEIIPPTEPQKAIELLNRSLSLNPKFADGYNNRASRKNDLKDYEGALQDADSAIRLKGPFFHGLNNRGVALQNLGKNESALKEYRRALFIEPQNPQVIYNIGNVHFDLGDLDSAIFYFKKAHETQNTFSDALYNLGVAYLKKMDFESACSIFIQGANQGNTSCAEAIDKYCKPWEAAGKPRFDPKTGKPIENK